jgi:hypothetical protein
VPHASLHKLAVLWTDTTRLGCGLKRCPGAMGSYVVCWYGPGFYMTPDFKSKYKRNVPRSRCQLATGDDWCASCSGRRCTACFARPQYGQEMALFPITYNAARKRVSTPLAELGHGWCWPAHGSQEGLGPSYHNL